MGTFGRVCQSTEIEMLIFCFGQSMFEGWLAGQYTAMKPSVVCAISYIAYYNTVLWCI